MNPNLQSMYIERINCFLDLTPKAKVTNEKIKWDQSN